MWCDVTWCDMTWHDVTWWDIFPKVACVQKNFWHTAKCSSLKGYCTKMNNTSPIPNQHTTFYHHTCTSFIKYLYFLRYCPLYFVKIKILWPYKFELFVLTNLKIQTWQIPKLCMILDPSKPKNTWKIQIWIYICTKKYVFTYFLSVLSRGDLFLSPTFRSLKIEWPSMTVQPPQIT